MIVPTTQNTGCPSSKHFDLFLVLFYKDSMFDTLYVHLFIPHLYLYTFSKVVYHHNILQRNPQFRIAYSFFSNEIWKSITKICHLLFHRIQGKNSCFKGLLYSFHKHGLWEFFSKKKRKKKRKLVFQYALKQF